MNQKLTYEDYENMMSEYLAGFKPALPSRRAFAFINYFSALIDSYRPLRADLIQAIRAHDIFREASQNVMPENLRNRKLSAKQLSAYMKREVRRMGRARPVANLRAHGVLITLESILEDLIRVVRQQKHHFGPDINGVPFTLLLRAGANSARHGGEWWHLTTQYHRTRIRAEFEDEPIPPSPSWTPQQLASIGPIVRALGLEDSTVASNQIGVDVLKTLSDGGQYDVLHVRMIEASAHIAVRTNLREALLEAAEYLGMVSNVDALYVKAKASDRSQ